MPGPARPCKDCGKPCYGIRCRYCDSPFQSLRQIGNKRSFGWEKSEEEKQVISKTMTRHGHTDHGNRSPTHTSWSMMIRRCEDLNYTRYPLYGGRGIMVCQRWHIFENFLEDMGIRPAGKTIDRINNNGNYEPENCRWATPKQQAHNRRVLL